MDTFCSQSVHCSSIYCHARRYGKNLHLEQSHSLKGGVQAPGRQPRLRRRTGLQGGGGRASRAQTCWRPLLGAWLAECTVRALRGEARSDGSCKGLVTACRLQRLKTGREPASRAASASPRPCPGPGSLCPRLPP